MWHTIIALRPDMMLHIVSIFLLMSSSYAYISNERIHRAFHQRMTQYDAQLPSEALAGLLTTSGVLMVAGSIWWTDVIPKKRMEVAKSKANGEIRSMLDDIRESSEGEKQLQKWFFSDWLRKEKKPAAIPFLKKAKWNSGDNPVLVAFGGIMSLVVATSLRW
jgi:hypothetical protein